MPVLPSLTTHSARETVLAPTFIDRAPQREPALVLAAVGAAAHGDRCKSFPTNSDCVPTLGQQVKTGTGPKGDLQPRSFGSPPGDQS